MTVAEQWPSIRHVVLDWNGTLLDDLDLAVDSVNHVCRTHGLPTVDRQRYRAHFCFPIEAFYQALGFDFDHVPFSTVVRDYLLRFDANVRYCPLHKGALNFLTQVQSSGRSLSVLSASLHATLVDTLQAKGLMGYFDQVYGLGHEHATSKLSEAQLLQSRLGLPPSQVLFIGDTTHDAEIADAMGWHSAIFSMGHQDETRLAECKVHHSTDFEQLMAVLGLSRSNTEVIPN